MVTPIRFLPVRTGALRQSRVNYDGSTSLCDEDHGIRNCFLKYGSFVLFAVLVFFIAEYYFYGITMGVAAIIFCSILIILLVIGGLITLCEAAMRSNDSRLGLRDGPTPEQQNQENVEREMPPHYSRVVLNPVVNSRYKIRKVKIHSPPESPPPSYDNIKNEVTEISQKNCQ